MESEPVADVLARERLTVTGSLSMPGSKRAASRVTSSARR
jgi:hypothetical protein